MAAGISSNGSSRGNRGNRVNRSNRSDHSDRSNRSNCGNGIVSHPFTLWPQSFVTLLWYVGFCVVTIRAFRLATNRALGDPATSKINSVTTFRAALRRGTPLLVFLWLAMMVACFETHHAAIKKPLFDQFKKRNVAGRTGCIWTTIVYLGLFPMVVLCWELHNFAHCTEAGSRKLRLRAEKGIETAEQLVGLASAAAQDGAKELDGFRETETDGDHAVAALEEAVGSERSKLDVA